MEQDLTLANSTSQDFGQAVSLKGNPRFFEFVREERLFCAALAHLLLQRGDNLRSFINLINVDLPEGLTPDSVVQDAEIYLEFTYLRDRWNLLRSDNTSKRALIADWFSRVPSLDRIPNTPEKFPEDISAFNALFMGPRGGLIRNDIVYPGQWSVRALSETFSADKEVFFNLCKFKWSFNIKPDLVILLPGLRPICVEAKLESKEGYYPSSNAEALKFDELFGIAKKRVGQLDLQEFMFEVLLDAPCQPVVLSRSHITPRVGDGATLSSKTSLTWRAVFAHLNTDASLPFVKNLIERNRYLSTEVGTLSPEVSALTEAT